MKRTIFYFTVICMLGLLFASCKATYMKRHYMKGYYVEHKKHSSKTPVATLPKGEKQPEQLERKDAALDIKSEEPEVVLRGETAAAEPLTDIKSDKGELAVEKSVPCKSKYFKRKLKAIKFKPPGLGGFSDVRATAEKIVSPEAGIIAATLSLFWIVLVILLVFYLIGILFEGFGLGGLFHLMGVVLLVLLILWLLGVV